MLKEIVLKAKKTAKNAVREAAGLSPRPMPPASMSGLHQKPFVPKQRKLTNAAMVYAVGAGVLFMLAIYNLFFGSIFNGIVILLPAGGLLALSYKYIQ